MSGAQELLVAIAFAAGLVLAIAAAFDVRFIRWAAQHWLAHADGVDSYRVGRREGLERWAKRMPKPVEGVTFYPRSWD